MTSRKATRTRLAALLLAVMAGIGLSGLVAAPAQAEYGNCVGLTATEWRIEGAWVCFEPEDELLKVCDTEPDGHHASAAVRGSADDHWFEVGAYGGYLTCRTRDFNMPEDSHICYAAMIVEGNAIQYIYPTYSGWVSARDGALNGGCPGFKKEDVVME
ncbi:hypothetical protein [Glycomyces harbinensis]|uniref:Uncharacterized protein n=1 Tax=Glycomyces harbinensis TaxID=58114 RepID=A0A1G6VNM9_9ACTN|nr:hypothetical protein [Glycomyces harbinensis]SDD54475.1 hypothetical protein SAMN05216270_10513 [Glycomyces harbinensis]